MVTELFERRMELTEHARRQAQIFQLLAVKTMEVSILIDNDAHDHGLSHCLQKTAGTKLPGYLDTHLDQTAIASPVLGKKIPKCFVLDPGGGPRPDEVSAQELLGELGDLVKLG